MLRNVLKARYGQIWNENMAFIRKMPYTMNGGIARDGLCPLCRQPDSCAHIFGGCRHPEMVKAYIAGHNEAGKMILEAIKNGPIGNNFMISDVETKETMQEHGTQGMRLPVWFAKPETIQQL